TLEGSLFCGNVSRPDAPSALGVEGLHAVDVWGSAFALGEGGADIAAVDTQLFVTNTTFAGSSVDAIHLRRTSGGVVGLGLRNTLFADVVGFAAAGWGIVGGLGSHNASTPGLRGWATGDAGWTADTFTGTDSLLDVDPLLKGWVPGT